MTIDRHGLLFLCVANSARSQVAEGLARQLAPEGWDIYSAGSAPEKVNPYAIAAMKKIGIDISDHSSKAIDNIPTDNIHTVITLCADEICPVFPHLTTRLHWPHPDPAAVKGSDEEILTSFCEVRDQIREKLVAFWG